MKTVSLIVICAMGLTFHASAQKVIRAVPRYYPRSNVSVGIGFGAWSPYNPYWYNPWYAYPPGYAYRLRPSELDLEIQDIQLYYKDKIWSVRNDESLSRKEKRKKIHELKQERDNEILEAKRDYYYRRR